MLCSKRLKQMSTRSFGPDVNCWNLRVRVGVNPGTVLWIASPPFRRAERLFLPFTNSLRLFSAIFRPPV